MRIHDDGRALIFIGLAMLALGATSASAQSVPLGTAGNFGALGGSAVTNTGPSVVTGSVGVSPGTSITGFPPGTIVAGSGTMHSADAVALQAQNDLTVAYNDAAGRPGCTTIAGGLLGSGGATSLGPGVYCMGSGSLTGTLTLNGAGTYIFQMGSSLTTASGSSVVLAGGASSCDIFWQVTSSATIGTGSSMSGNILALTSITLNTNASLSGSALARNGAVTLDSNAVSLCGAAAGGLAQTAVTTQASASVPVGGLIHDTALLANGVAPTGSITFSLYGPDDATCSAAPAFTSTVPVNGNGNYNSANFTVLIAGTYRWIAAYSGDAGNAASTTACNDPNETVIVSALAPATAVPALAVWLLTLLAALLAISAMAATRRRTR
ncbi:MAG: ice-binding family protein [Rhodanobacteraceae bacterium]